MSDLNIINAQNADVKSRVSDTGLACDSPASAPDRKDIDAFELAMRGGIKDHRESSFASAFSQSLEGDEEKNFSESCGKNNSPQIESSQAQLASLFTMVNTFSQVEAPVRAEAPHAILTEADLNMLVERILVSAANNGTQEVRLILNEHVLAGTEIILSRDLSGQLAVALHCADASTFQTLVASQFDLKQMLESKEASPVQVSVDIHQDGNDAERRSRGYFDYDPEQLRKRDNA